MLKFWYNCCYNYYRMSAKKEKSSRLFTIIYVLLIVFILAAEISIEFAFKKPGKLIYGASITLSLPALSVPAVPLP